MSSLAASPADPPPAVTAVLLAAGAGRRAGGPKALRTGPDGVPWLTRSVGVLRDGGCPEVVVVLGCRAEPARRLVSGLAGVRVVIAEDWERGLGASLRAGLTALGPSASAVVHLVDLPDVGADVVRRLLRDGGSGPRALARAGYRGRPGHPVLIGAGHVPEVLAQLRGDTGAGAYLRRHRARLVDCADLATGQDRDD